MEELVEFAVLHGRKILYLVNRTILKRQLEEKIDTDVKVKLRKYDDDEFNKNLDNVIDVKMYQQIEEECKRNPQELESSETEYTYIVADECHYFLADSTFNTYTQLSYEWIMAKRENVNTIFISATLRRLKELMIQDERIEYKDCKSLVETESDSNNLTVSLLRGEMGFCPNVTQIIEPYQVDSNYSYISPHALKDTEDIVKTIENEKGKWIVFVDSIKNGVKIHKLLKKSDIDSIFMDSFLKNHDYNVREAIEEISKIECFEEQVLIATAVMDNGISIKDTKVRNMIIMADTYEEFIQMIGRKRMLNNGDSFNVYFLKRNSGDFTRKLKEVNEELKFINRHWSMQSVPLYEMMESESCYFFVRRAYYLLEYSLKLNKFAFEQFRYLQSQYQKIIQRFEEDSSAFIREQIEWLGRKSDEIDDMTKEEADRLIERVSRILESVVDKVLTKEENLELRENLREDLKELLIIKLESFQDKKLKRELETQISEFGKTSFSKKDDPSSKPRTLTVQRFNKVAHILGLEYRMEPKEDKESGTYCRIIKYDSPQKES